MNAGFVPRTRDGRESGAETLRKAIVELLRVHEREGTLPTSARLLLNAVAIILALGATPACAECINQRSHRKSRWLGLGPQPS